MSVPTLYTYTLQVDELAAGTMTVKIHSQYDDLVVPSFSSLEYGEVNERYDAIPGRVEIDEMIVRIHEDYSTHFEGFWYKVTSGYSELQFILDEGSGDTHFFWGRVVGPAASLEELAIVGGDIIRRGELRLVSLLVKMKEFLCSDFTTTGGILEDQLIKITNWQGLGDDIWFVKVHEVIASAIATVYDQAYDLDDVVQQEDDFEFNDGTVWHTLPDMYLYYGVDPNIPAQWTTDMNAQFSTVYDLIIGIVKEFGLVPRYFYDLSDSRHKIELMTRGRSYAASTFLTPIKSTKIQQAYPPVNVLAKRRSDIAGGGVDEEFHMINGVGNTGQPPDALTVDYDITCQWILRSAEYGGADSPQRGIYPTDGAGGVMGGITDTKFWNYTSGAMDNNTDVPVKPRVLEYFYNRFGFSKGGYERIYPSIKSTFSGNDSHANNYVLRVTSISDGLSDRNYYAAEVSKNPVTNQCKILWHEV